MVQDAITLATLDNRIYLTRPRGTTRAHMNRREDDSCDIPVAAGFIRRIMALPKFLFHSRDQSRSPHFRQIFPNGESRAFVRLLLTRFAHRTILNDTAFRPLPFVSMSLFYFEKVNSCDC
jgi:hypothetical protein